MISVRNAQSSGRDHINREERFCDMMHQMDVTAKRTKYENIIFYMFVHPDTSVQPAQLQVCGKD